MYLTDIKMQPPNGDAILARFLRSTESMQFDLMHRLSVKELVVLRDMYFAWAEDEGDGPLSMAVLGAMLAKCEPQEYDDAWQDADLRVPWGDGLKAMRMDTYDSQIRPLLTKDVSFQEQFVRSLPRDEQESLLKLLDRYARDSRYGRSMRCRNMENLVRENLKR